MSKRGTITTGPRNDDTSRDSSLGPSLGSFIEELEPLLYSRVSKVLANSSRKAPSQPRIAAL